MTVMTYEKKDIKKCIDPYPEKNTVKILGKTQR